MSEAQELPVNQVICGDALEVLKSLPENSVDAICCDPPAGIGFMNKDFDSDKGGRDHWVAWLTEVMQAAIKVLRPGGHALVWSLPRTSHWTGYALENAGFEIRDSIQHVYGASEPYHKFLASLTPDQQQALKILLDSQSAPSMIAHLFGSGFPKSLSVDKAIDKLAKAEREVVGLKMRPDGRSVIQAMPNGYAQGMEHDGWHFPWKDDFEKVKLQKSITAPATDAAKRWRGWGSALKPAFESWILCRKPLSEKSIAENVLRWSAGALNIDSCRVGAMQTAHFETEPTEWCDCGGGIE